MPFTNKLKDGEEILFGPVVSELEPKGRGQSELHQITAAPTASRTVAITNQRILVATGSRAVTIPNDNVIVVHLGKTKTKSGQPVYTLLRAYRTSNQVAQLDIPGLDSSAKARLEQIFPNAEIRIHTNYRGVWIVGIIAVLVGLGTLAVMLLR